MAQAQHLTLAQTLESLAVKEVELFCPIAQAPPKTDGKELDRHAAGWAVRQGLCAPHCSPGRASESSSRPRLVIDMVCGKLTTGQRGTSCGAGAP
ncbi:hypothetical protein ACWDZW_25270 [Streptomyces coeruleorubidus]